MVAFAGLIISKYNIVHKPELRISFPTLPEKTEPRPVYASRQTNRQADTLIAILRSDTEGGVDMRHVELGLCALYIG